MLNLLLPSKDILHSLVSHFASYGFRLKKLIHGSPLYKSQLLGSNLGEPPLTFQLASAVKRLIYLNQPILL